MDAGVFCLWDLCSGYLAGARFFRREGGNGQSAPWLPAFRMHGQGPFFRSEDSPDKLHRGLSSLLIHVRTLSSGGEKARTNCSGGACAATEQGVPECGQEKHDSHLPQIHPIRREKSAAVLFCRAVIRHFYGGGACAATGQLFPERGQEKHDPLLPQIHPIRRERSGAVPVCRAVITHCRMAAQAPPLQCIGAYPRP